MSDLSTLAYRAIEHHENGELEAAEALYRTYLDAVEHDPPIEHLLGMLRLVRGDPAEARVLVQRAADAVPEAADYRADLALILQALGERDAALDAHRAAARLEPDEPALLRRIGRALREAGEPAEAARLLHKALHLDDGRDSVVELVAALEVGGRRGDALDALERFHQRHPDDAHVLHLLGAVALRHGQHDRAHAALVQVTRMSPGSAGAHNDVGALALQAEDFEAAVSWLSRSVAIDPAYANAHYNLAKALENLTRYDEAVVHYERAIELDPDHVISYRNLAAVYYKAGRHDLMAGVLERHLSRHPDDVRTRHMLAAARGDRLDSSDPTYVRELFDNFALSYDQRLARIEYRGPGLLALALERLGSTRYERVLDAGCGTGLCAPVLRPNATTLVGVDLSPKMLEQARALASYDELHEGELVAFLENLRTPFDLVAVVDTFVYIGELAAALTAAAAALRPGGTIIFTVEAHPDASADSFELGPSGRFQHTRPYLESRLRRAGLGIRLFETVHLRLELGDPVVGYLVAAGRAPA